MRIVIELDPSDKGFQEIVNKAIRESLRSEHGVASQTDLKNMEKRIMATLDEVLQKVTDQDTALDSVRALITGLRQQLADALANANLSPANQAKVDAIFTAAEKNSAEIVEALAENVPPGPTPTPIDPA